MKVEGDGYANRKSGVSILVFPIQATDTTDEIRRMEFRSFVSFL